jgi:hypothetical protein
MVSEVATGILDHQQAATETDHTDAASATSVARLAAQR